MEAIIRQSRVQISQKNGSVEISIVAYGVEIAENIPLGTLPAGFRPINAIRQHNYTGNIMLDISNSGITQLLLYDSATNFKGNLFIDKTYIAS